jgi:hypothetical protein
MVPCLPQPNNGHGIWLPALPLAHGFPHCSYKSRDFLTCRGSGMYCVVALTPTQRDLRFDIFALRDKSASITRMTSCGRRDYICCVISADRNAHGRDYVLSAARHRPAHIPPCATLRVVAALVIAVVGHVAAPLAPAVPGARIPPGGADVRAQVDAGVEVATTGRMKTTMSRLRLAPTVAIAAQPTATMRLISTARWCQHVMR